MHIDLDKIGMEQWNGYDVGDIRTATSISNKFYFFKELFAERGFKQIDKNFSVAKKLRFAKCSLKIYVLKSTCSCANVFDFVPTIESRQTNPKSSKKIAYQK